MIWHNDAMFIFKWQLDTFTLLSKKNFLLHPKLHNLHIMHVLD